jgi:hypothetical protein
MDGYCAVCRIRRSCVGTMGRLCKRFGERASTLVETAWHPSRARRRCAASGCCQPALNGWAATPLSRWCCASANACTAGPAAAPAQFCYLPSREGSAGRGVAWGACLMARCRTGNTVNCGGRPAEGNRGGAPGIRPAYYPFDPVRERKSQSNQGNAAVRQPDGLSRCRSWASCVTAGATGIGTSGRVRAR